MCTHVKNDAINIRLEIWDVGMGVEDTDLHNVGHLDYIYDEYSTNVSTFT